MKKDQQTISAVSSHIFFHIYLSLLSTDYRRLSVKGWWSKLNNICKSSAQTDLNQAENKLNKYIYKAPVALSEQTEASRCIGKKGGKGTWGQAKFQAEKWCGHTKQSATLSHANSVHVLCSFEKWKEKKLIWHSDWVCKW